MLLEINSLFIHLLKIIDCIWNLSHLNNYLIIGPFLVFKIKGKTVKFFTKLELEYVKPICSKKLLWSNSLHLRKRVMYRKTLVEQ